MADMRLFHHFLITAYPHLPAGGDKIWVTVIPSFAHNVGPLSLFHVQSILNKHGTKVPFSRLISHSMSISSIRS